MKLILSRKGFDSANGGMPNPILPDGTLLSLPIPDWDDGNSFDGLLHEGDTYLDIIRSLKPRFNSHTNCHLDPDLRADIKQRPDGWLPTFGQMGSALTILKNAGVAPDDLFLFFGWFRQTEYNKNGELKFVKNAPDLHILYGYLQIGEVITRKEKVPEWLIDQPHFAYEESWEKGKNAMFISSRQLSFAPELPGAGVFKMRPDRILTKPGMTRRYWDLPDFFREVSITCHPNPWREDCFESVCLGQEFVMEATPPILDWAKARIMD